MPNPENNKTPKKSLLKVRGYSGMVMGLFYFFVAYWVIHLEKIGQIHIGTTFSYLAAALMALYGLFRIYRGFKLLKDENNNQE